MILPIFLTTQFLSIKLDEKNASNTLVNLRPLLDPFLPVVSTLKIREILKDLLKEDELKDIEPIIVSIATDNYDIEPTYDFNEVVGDVPFAVIVPEYYYQQAINFLSPHAVNLFLDCRKYAIEIPADIKIQIDSIAISLYTKENVGKFISQSQIVISTTDVDSKFKAEYTEAMIKALSDNIQVAGVWSIFIDTDYELFPNLINAIEKETPIDEFFENFTNASDGKLIIAPGVKEIELGENGNFETLEITDQQLNKFKIKEEDKITFKWKSDKSKFEGEIFGSKTGIKLDARERLNK